MKNLEQNTNINISRHGTFISNIKYDYEKIISKIYLIINNEISKDNISNENREILKNIYNSPKNSKNINLINNSEDFNFNFSSQEISWLYKHPENQWIEYLIYRYKFKIYSINKKLQKFPQYLLIEPTSICNIRCIMCFQVDESFSSNKNFMGFMKLDLFQKIINEAYDNECHAITLASRGEPTLHKDFSKLCKILGSKKFLDTKINTNATVLTEKKIHDILENEFSEVVFSVDAGTKNTYEKIRRLGKFDKVVSNIENFQNIREKYYSKSPTITRIAGVKVNDEQDLLQMSNFWSNYVDEVSVKIASPRWDSYNNNINSETNPCLNLWYRLYIWYDGIANPCDFDYKSFLQKGNLNKNSIINIWNSDEFQKMRKDHLNKLRKKYTPCDRCPITN